MSAYDWAIEREDEARQRSEISLQDISTNDPAFFKFPRSYGSGVFLITFIGELFTEENAHQALETQSRQLRIEPLGQYAWQSSGLCRLARPYITYRSTLCIAPLWTGSSLQALPVSNKTAISCHKYQNRTIGASLVRGACDFSQWDLSCS
jgi:hypothetical protein